MKKSTEIIILIFVIVVAFVVIYIEIPATATPVSSNAYTTPTPSAPVAEIVDTTAGYTAYGAPYFYGTVKSNTAMPVTADIAADIYDASGRVQLAHGDSEVGLPPFGQSPYQVIIYKSVIYPANWEYRVYVEDVQ